MTPYQLNQTPESNLWWCRMNSSGSCQKVIHKQLYSENHMTDKISLDSCFARWRSEGLLCRCFIFVFWKSQSFYHFELRYRIDYIYLCICIYVCVICHTPGPPFYCVHKSHYQFYCVHNNVNQHVLCIFCLYFVRNDENKDDQSIIQSIDIQ